MRLQTSKGRIFGETEANGEPGDQIGYVTANQLVDGPYTFYLMPRPWEMYESHVRMTHNLPLWVSAGQPYSQAPYGDFETRKADLLRYANRFESVYHGEVARMLLDRWSEVEVKPILVEIDAVRRQTEGSAARLASLLGVSLHLGENPSFPDALRGPLEEAVLAFHYSPDSAGRGPLGESRQILLYTCAVLAGQIYPERTFQDGRTGRQIREEGERLAQEWLRARGQSGFADWDSPEGYAEDVLALALLIDLAEDETLFDLASVVLDKIFFSLAVNSYKGTFGSARRRANAITARSGLMDEMAGISRLMWGMGVYNVHLAAPLALAMLQNYEFPPIIEQIASSSEELWNRENQAGEVNKVTYRTADYMLSSAQDYFPGQPGKQEHLWQATLGPNALVFANHPAYSSDETGLLPGFWQGSRVLPRIAQWKDVLVALHNLPEDDWMGFTHAYFPAANFEEVVMSDGWAFARVGSGYLALTATNGLEQVTQGPRAFRELRSRGNQNIWLCHMGSAQQDGDFAAFQEKILNMPVSFDGLSVTLQSLRGESLSFGWEGPFKVNDQEQPLSGYSHYDNLYCSAPQPCQEMEIRTSDYLLRLKFGDKEA